MKVNLWEAVEVVVQLAHFQAEVDRDEMSHDEWKVIFPHPSLTEVLANF